MKWKFISFSVAFFAAVNLYAETCKYRITLRDDPSTTATICWVQTSGQFQKVYYSKTDFGDDYISLTDFKSVDMEFAYKGMYHCFARLTCLEPNTVYYFVIIDNNSVSRKFWFKTLPDNKVENISIVAGGDSHTNRDVRQLANKMVCKLQPDIVIFNGGFTSSANDQDWADWLEDWQLTINEEGRIIPIIVANGNHEEDEDIFYIFDLPDEKEYYDLNLGGNLLSVFILNTEIKISGEQTEWLSSRLEASEALWRIAVYHKPMRPHHEKEKEGNDQYKYWAELFYQYNVRLAIEGDSHTCKVTWPIVPSKEKEADEGFARDTEGTVYIGEGCWGAPLREADDNKSWTRDSEMINQFKWIFVSSAKMEIRTVKYENVNEVEQLTYDTRFELPENIDLWQPSNGSVVEIKK